MTTAAEINYQFQFSYLFILNVRRSSKLFIQSETAQLNENIVKRNYPPRVFIALCFNILK